MLSPEAFNALLKTLEEPPSHVIFILATTEIHKVMQTIKSRCQRFDFHRIASKTIADRLHYVANQENAELSDSAAMLIAAVADGGMRDALSLLDRCIALSTEVDEKIVASAAGLADKSYLYDLSACIINKNTAKSLEIIANLYSGSKDMSRLCSELIDHFRSLMLIKSVKNPREILIMSDDEFEKALTQSDYLSLADIVYYMDVLSRAFQRMGKGTGDRTELETAMVKLSAPELDATSEAIAARITALENAVKSGIAFKTQKQNDAQQDNSDDEPESNAHEAIDNIPDIVQQEEIKEPVKNSAPVTKAPPQIPEPAPKKSVNLDEIYSNAKPFPKWVEVINNLKPFSRAIAAAFDGSTAYESGAYLLIDTQNEIAFDLLKEPKRRDEIRRVIQETTGRVYKLGPYKRPEKVEKQTDNLEKFKDIIKESGISLTEE